jgi:hypothetical protein
MVGAEPDERRAHVDRQQAATGSLEVQFAATGEAASPGLRQQLAHHATLGFRMELPQRSSAERLDRTDLTLGDLVRAVDDAVVRAHHQHRRRCGVDGAAVAFGLVGNVALASFDEEVRDVQDTLPELLIQQTEQLRQIRVAAQLAVHQIDDDLADLELAGEKARRHVLRDEAAPRVAAQHGVGLDVLGIADVGDPATLRADHVVRHLVHDVGVDLQRVPDRGRPDPYRFLAVGVHEVGELAAQRRLRAGKSQQPAATEIALDSLEVLGQRRNRRGVGVARRIVAASAHCPPIYI